MYLYIKPQYLAPPPPNTRAMLFPVRILARREKSEWRSGHFSNTRWYNSLWKPNTHTHKWKWSICWYSLDQNCDQKKTCNLVISTSFGKLLLENTLRGQERWWCLEIQLRMFSHSAVPLGGGPSSLCSNTSCFWARTALPSNIRSSYRGNTGFRSAHHFYEVSFM